jgi:hypothetical protein
MAEQARGNWLNTIGWLILLLGWLGILYLADVPELVETRADARTAIYRYAAFVHAIWATWLVAWWLWAGRQLATSLKARWAPGILGGLTALALGVALLLGLTDVFTQQVAISNGNVTISTVRTRTTGEVRFRAGELVSFYRAPLPRALFSGNLRQRLHLERLDVPPLVLTLAPPGRAAVLELLREQKVPEIAVPPK